MSFKPIFLSERTHLSRVTTAHTVPAPTVRHSEKWKAPDSVDTRMGNEGKGWMANRSGHLCLWKCLGWLSLDIVQPIDVQHWEQMPQPAGSADQARVLCALGLDHVGALCLRLPLNFAITSKLLLKMKSICKGIYTNRRVLTFCSYHKPIVLRGCIISFQKEDIVYTNSIRISGHSKAPGRKRNKRSSRD